VTTQQRRLRDLHIVGHKESHIQQHTHRESIAVLKQPPRRRPHGKVLRDGTEHVVGAAAGRCDRDGADGMPADSITYHPPRVKHVNSARRHVTTQTADEVVRVEGDHDVNCTGDAKSSVDLDSPTSTH